MKDETGGTGHFPGSPGLKTPFFQCKGCWVPSLVGDLRSHKPPGQNNQNMKQKLHCNKCNKDFKKGPHQKKSFERISMGLFLSSVVMNDRSHHGRASFLTKMSLGVVAKTQEAWNTAIYFAMETKDCAATTERGSEVGVPETPGHTRFSADDAVHGKASRVFLLSHSSNYSPDADSKGTWSWSGKSRTSGLCETCCESLSLQLEVPEVGRKTDHPQTGLCLFLVSWSSSSIYTIFNHFVVT